jgi:TolB-like protein
MKPLLMWGLLLVGVVSVSAQQRVITLDEAIGESIRYLSERLPAKVKVAVLNFSAPTAELSGYVIEELTTCIVNDDNLTVVDRLNMELVQREITFQSSGEVSDATAQAIGQKIGAQTIVSGSCTPLGDVYRLRVRAIKVETAEVQGQYSATIRSDSTLAALLHIKYRDPGDFTPAQQIGAGFLNTIVGLGSFTMGDMGGGLILCAGYALAAGLIVWDVLGFAYDDPLAGVPGTIGFGLAVVTVGYGFVRPFTWHRPAQAAGLSIAPIVDKTGIQAVRVAYTWRF